MGSTQQPTKLGDEDQQANQEQNIGTLYVL